MELVTVVTVYLPLPQNNPVEGLIPTPNVSRAHRMRWHAKRSNYDPFFNRY